jgi:nitrite reductase/ring-hydroxylating ferredoxin subunit
MSKMAQFVKVAKTSDINPGEIVPFYVEGESVAICRVNGEYYAIKDECSHMEYPLSDGFLEGEVITCAWHGAKFDVRTGEVLSMPAVVPVETYQLKVEGEDIYVLIEE